MVSAGCRGHAGWFVRLVGERKAAKGGSTVATGCQIEV